MFADYHILRKAIDESDSKYQDLMRISYLFGVRVSELLPDKKGGDALEGRHFSETSIEGDDALQLSIPTRWQDGKPRTTVVPLNPIYEEWSKMILDLSEERYNKKIHDITSRTYQQHVQDNFQDLEWYENGYFKRKRGKKTWQSARKDSLQTKHFREIRELELALVHKFTSYEIMHFFGISGLKRDISYFKKLLRKSDIYMSNDIEGSIRLNKFIFNPRLREIDYNSYVQIQKMIKKGQILLLPPENINIDDSVNLSPKKNDEIEHRILKSNIKIHLMKQGSENVTYEYANLDVVDYDKNIVVECGKSYGNKILDVYDNVYQGIPKINEFWIVDYYDESMISKLYKFKLIG